MFLSKTHLNAGIGFPCAGHKRENGCPDLALNDPNVSELVENLGKDIPIGSTEEVKKIPLKIYLNDGKGDPWAGQVIPTPMFEAIVKADNSNFEENLGLEDPMGSNKKFTS